MIKNVVSAILGIIGMIGLVLTMLDFKGIINLF